jgi:hypothetical protein
MSELAGPAAPKITGLGGPRLAAAGRGGAGVRRHRHRLPADPADTAPAAGHVAGVVDHLVGADLMTALLIKRPLEFTAFPTVLLVATLFRLG